MAFKTASKFIRNLFLQCLRLNGLSNRFYTAQQIADICNYAAGLTADNGIDAAVIGRAFTYSTMDESSYYSLPFQDVAPMNDSTISGMLCAYIIGRRFKRGGDRMTAIGRFTSVENEAAALQRLLSQESSSRLNLRQWDFSFIDARLVDEFSNYIKPKPPKVSLEPSDETRPQKKQRSSDSATEATDYSLVLQRMQSRRKRLESTIASLESDLLAKKQQLNELREEEEAIFPLVSKELLPNEDTLPVESSVAVLLDGKVGCVPRRELIYLSDVLNSIDSGSSLVFPNNYKRDNYGTKEFLVPPGVTTIATKDWGKYQRDHERMKRLRKLMKGKKCTFSHEAQMIMGCGYHCNSGGSDEASIHIQAATLRALFFDMGIPDYEVSNLMIARALPSRTQVRNIDLRL
eukprot:scaffold51495_cov38-Cyclotella_meneghiniana.AAC.7